jgi:hypothetical protein
MEDRQDIRSILWAVGLIIPTSWLAFMSAWVAGHVIPLLAIAYVLASGASRVLILPC